MCSIRSIREDKETIIDVGQADVVCIGDTPAGAESYYRRTIEVLDREGGTQPD